MLAAALLAATAVLAVAAGTAGAEVIYNNIPSPLPGNLASYGNGAYSMSEFGGQVAFRGTARHNPGVSVVMSSWACEFGNWQEATCESPKANSKFPVEVTLKVYEVGPGNSLGNEVAFAAKTFKMPYRPSDSKSCTGGTWYDKYTHQCFHGKAFRINFKLKPRVPVKHVPLILPEKVIIGVSYNTTHDGPQPKGEEACNNVGYNHNAGCFYDSLNVAVAKPEGSFLQGTDPTEELYVNSTYTAMFCSGGIEGTFGPANCPAFWAGEQPAIEVNSLF